ncbi:MAG: DUF1501 domain-containing protein, partial [Pirellula sp.]
PKSSARAKRMIFCFMDGGPSHVDTFDYKPMLKKHQGQTIGSRWVSKKSQSDANRVWFGCPWEFKQRGQSGLWVSELFPRIAEVADKLCVVRSMVGELPLHGQSNLLLHTGRSIGMAPSIGAWLSYGLGTENANLPAYVLLNNDWVPNGGMENFGSSFLPANHQATMLRAKGNPVDNIIPLDSSAIQRRKLDSIARLDRAFSQTTSDPQAIESMIANYETAFRMQTAVPELADISQEPEYIHKLYGTDSSDEHQRYYASQALRARRLVEAGVRFIEITCPSFDGNNSPWDQHGQLKVLHEKNARVTEQSVAALIQDLDQRGLLDETIVLWAGEMGRTPHTGAINENTGRDHHVSGFSIFLAGGGFKPGTVYGQTDEFGANAIENPMSVHDLHATILHQMGIDHEALTFRYGGRDHRLTDVHGHIVNAILA